MNYDQLVQAGKTCITKLEGAEVVVGKHRLTLGRLALEACGPPTGQAGRKPANAQIHALREFADAIGFPEATLRDYRKVAHQWASVADAAEYSWAVLTLIADADDKELILANTVERFGRITIDTLREYTGRRTTHDAKLEQARKEATEAAEIKAAQRLAAALERQAKDNEAKAKLAEAKAAKDKQDAIKKTEQQQKLKHEANIQEIQKRMKAEADAESAKKLAHIEELLRAEIAAEPPTPAVLAAMAQQALASDDPNIVQQMAEAYGEMVAKRLAAELRTKKEREAEARRRKAERDAESAVARHSLEYEDSALRIFNDGYDTLYEAHLLKNRKEITHSNLVASGLMFGEMLDRCQTLRDIADEMETAIKNAGAEGAIEEAMADVTLDDN